MEVVIPKEETQGHIVSKYNFKVLSMGAAASKGEAPQSVLTQKEASDSEVKPAAVEAAEENVAPVAGGNRDELVESLLKKTDDISSNFIKMQMKIEQMESEHVTALEAAKKEAYEKGLAEGRVQFEQELKHSHVQGTEQFAASVKTLEASAQQLDNAFEGVKEELVHAALDIAKEVVSGEVEERASQIASRLGNELVKELQNATKITLRVNPADHGILSERLGTLGHVEIISDSAVSPGGVIALSDAGNIDAQIMKRYERAKRAALSE